MVRTQVYLSRQQSEDIKLRARLSGQPEAAVVRDLIDKGLAVRPAKDSGGLMELASLNITGGPKDLSSRLDEYLYGGEA